MARLATLGVATPTRPTVFLQEVLLSWIEEFAADAFAGFLTGPAALFSLSEFLQLARHHGICDTHPSNELRRAAMFREMAAGTPSFCSVFEKHTGLKLTAEINSSLIVAAPAEAEIMQDMIGDGHSHEESAAIAALHGSMKPIAQAVYGSVRSYLNQNVPNLIYTASNYDADLTNHLAALLAAIPPIENGLDITQRRPCDFASIINVGWVLLLTKLDQLRVRTKPGDALGSEKVERLHDLLLKAVELSEARREWERDIRLGFEFALVSPSVRGSIDEFSDDKLSRLSTDLYRKEYVPLGGSFIIHPHQFILAATLEYIRLPLDLMSYVIGRSTWGRLGLIVATAVGIQPGFAGTLTLELRNLGETPLTLYPGQAIGQLFFHSVQFAASSQTEVPGIGQYGGVIDLLPRRISSEVTRTKIAALKAKNGLR